MDESMAGNSSGDLWNSVDVAEDSNSVEVVELSENGPMSNHDHANSVTADGRGNSSLQLKCVQPSMKSLHCVSFHDITYEVTQRKCFKRLPNKVILNSVSGLMLPGVNAIMGPTGSGKTSLLDIMADRKDKAGLTGTLLINGKRRPSNFKNLVGYVVQDDVVMGTLSVRENLHFSAALRLPSHTTFKQRKERVERVIEELGLRNCAKTKVGTEFLRGVSGGERKRTNIGMELIIEPQILFLDEPTTGLDAYTAVSVVQLLKDLSRNHNRIIILSIHQPRYSIFKLFDTLTLLSLGNPVYHGNAQKALQYFDNIGYVCEEHENPADYFLDVINRCEKTQKAIKGSKGDVESEELPSKEKDLVEVYRQSTEYQELHNVIDPILKNVKSSGGLNGVVRKFHWFRNHYATNFFWQLLIVMLRSAVNLIRNPGTSILQIFTLTLFAFVIGGIYYQLPADYLGVSNRLGVFFFIATNQAFGSLSAIELFIQQRALFIHEYASGYYGVLPFFIAKVSLDLFTIRLLPNILFAVITYFMVGFQLVASKFFLYFLFVTLTQVSAVSVAFCISAATRVAGIANLLIAIVFVVSMLFGGLLVALESLPAWIQWMKFLSFVRYSIEGMAINEMDGLTFTCFNQTESSDMMMNVTSSTSPPSFQIGDFTDCPLDGLVGLSRLGYETTWLPWDILALILFSLLFLTIAYIILVLIKKEK